MTIAYYNGDFLPLCDINIPIMDRGFLFGDGIYEVIPVFNGKMFRFSEHMTRLKNSLAGIRLDSPLPDEVWKAILERIIDENSAPNQSLYVQITRGAYNERHHGFPKETHPSIFVRTTPVDTPSSQTLSAGIAAITLPDIRWQKCYIKAITLLPNVLMYQEALDRGAKEAILIRDGHAIEASSSNLFIVQDGEIITPPNSEHMLAGITRDLLLELAAAHGLPHRETPITQAALHAADEIWLTGSTKELLPVIQLDGKLISQGKAGPIWHKMITLYQDYKAQY